MTENSERRIKIISEMVAVEASLFSEMPSDEPAVCRGDDIHDTEDTLEISTVALFEDDGDQVIISYRESEESGMDGAKTVITFKKSEPDTVTMFREGAVSANLVFEKGKRCHCIYKTPIMPFEVCISTKTVDNRLFSHGELFVDYIVEIRGAQAEQTKLTLKLL